MSSPTQNDGDKLQQLVQQLSEVAKGYDPSPGAAGYISRTNVSHVAKEIVRLMMAPSDMSMHHAANVCQLQNPKYRVLTVARCWKSWLSGPC